WYRPTDCVSRGSSTGGSHDEARVIVPPRLGGFGLAGTQSRYVGAAAQVAARGPASDRAVSPAPARPVRFRNSRRFTRSAEGWWRRSVGILALLCDFVRMVAASPSDSGVRRNSDRSKTSGHHA